MTPWWLCHYAVLLSLYSEQEFKALKRYLSLELTTPSAFFTLKCQAEQARRAGFEPRPGHESHHYWL